ncbi:MAG: FAD-dependent oxidoreductase, partial [Floccifex sp.]
SELISEKGKITQVKTTKIKFENRKMVPIEGSEQILQCDLLLIAAGFTGMESYINEDFHLDMTPRNTISTQANRYQTSEANIFAAGDVRRGQSLVVWAIHEGKECAREVDSYLMEYTNMD